MSTATVSTNKQTASVSLPAPGVYAIDPTHSEVGFVARHLIGTKVRGRFTKFDGTITVGDPVTASTLTAEVDASSIETGVGMRDDHLRTNDFLDVATYPTLTFVSTG